MRQIVSSLTNAKFEITASGRYPLPANSVEWFMWCPEITESREIPYVNVVWGGTNGEVYFDSLPIGNTTSWVELAYGEEAAQEAMAIDYADFQGARSKFEQDFPLAARRLSAYEKIIQNVSSKKGIRVSMFVHGRAGRATFRIRAQLAASKPSEDARSRIASTIETMKEAWDSIEEFAGSERPAAKKV